MSLVDHPADARLSVHAQALLRDAEQLRNRRDEIRHTAAGLGWRSPAAAVFAGHLDRTLAALGTTANLMFETAAALSRHQNCAIQRAHRLANAASVGARAVSTGAGIAADELATAAQLLPRWITR
jgi:menaquinone-dependent protoporphyrinogen IX oxidase